MEVDKVFARLDFVAHQLVFVDQAIALGHDPPCQLLLVTGDRQDEGRKPGIPDKGPRNGCGSGHHTILVGIHLRCETNLGTIRIQHAELEGCAPDRGRFRLGVHLLAACPRLPQQANRHLAATA